MCLQIIFFLWFFFEESVLSFPSCLSILLRILRPINSCDFLPGFLWYSVPFCFILIYLFCLGRVHSSLEHVALVKLQFVPLWGQVFSFMIRFRMKKCSVKGTFLGKDDRGWPWIVCGRLRNHMVLWQNVQGVGVDEGGWKRAQGAVLWNLERGDICYVIPSGPHPTGKNLGAQISWIHLGNRDSRILSGLLVPGTACFLVWTEMWVAWECEEPEFSLEGLGSLPGPPEHLQRGTSTAFDGGRGRRFWGQSVFKTEHVENKTSHVCSLERSPNRDGLSMGAATCGSLRSPSLDVGGQQRKMGWVQLWLSQPGTHCEAGSYISLWDMTCETEVSSWLHSASLCSLLIRTNHRASVLRLGAIQPVFLAHLEV